MPSRSKILYGKDTNKYLLTRLPGERIYCERCGKVARTKFPNQPWLCRHGAITGTEGKAAMERIKQRKRGNRIQIRQDQIAKWKAELKELAGDVKVTLKVSPHLQVAASIKEWGTDKDAGFDIVLNPKLIKDDKALNQHLDWLRETVSA